MLVSLCKGAQKNQQTCLKQRALPSLMLRHVDSKVHQTVGVAPFVVVPRDQLHEVIIEGDACSNIEEDLQVVKSVDTTSSSVQSRIPFMSPPAASLIAATMSSYFAPFSKRQVKSTTETSGVGTRKAIPVSFPLSEGRHFPTAFAAPVDEGIMFWDAQRPPRQSFPPRLGPSTVSWVAVIACTVVIKPSTIPNFS